MAQDNTGSPARNSSRGSFYIMLGMMALAAAIYATTSLVTGEMRSARQSAEQMFAEIKQEVEELNVNHAKTNELVETGLKRLDLWSVDKIRENTLGSWAQIEKDTKGSMAQIEDDTKGSMAQIEKDTKGSLAQFEKDTKGSIDKFVKCPLGC